MRMCLLCGAVEPQETSNVCGGCGALLRGESIPYRLQPPEPPGILITEPITEENFKDFQKKLRGLVPAEILEQWTKEDENKK